MADKPNVQGWQQKWQYRVKIDGFDAAYFSKGDIPSAEIEQSTFSPAGRIHDQKMPGRIKYSDITLEKGIKVGNDMTAEDWMRAAANPETNELGSPLSFQKTVEIERLDRRMKVIDRYTLYKAWCCKIEGDGFDDTSSDPAIEKLTICYDYYVHR